MIKKTMKNEQGFVLITSLLMLMVLMIIGISATNTTTIELRISGNDKVAKETFYQADAGTQAGMALAYDNASKGGYAADDLIVGAVMVKHKDFYLNENPTPSIPPTDSEWAAADAYFPPTAVPPIVPRTDLVFKSTLTLARGGSNQMVSGYEGAGRTSASGSVREFDIWSRHTGNANSTSTINIDWNYEIRN